MREKPRPGIAENEVVVILVIVLVQEKWVLLNILIQVAVEDFSDRLPSEGVISQQRNV